MKKIVILSLSLTMSIAVLANNAPVVNKTITKTITKIMPSNASTLPLNKYGAVDVNAKIPYDVQVPPSLNTVVQPLNNTLVDQWPELIPAQPTLKAKSYLLMDAKTGKVIIAYNANKALPPASLTKLMLLYIAEQELKVGTINLNDKVNVPVVAWATGGSRMFLKPHASVSVKDLISGIIVDSGNDAAVTLATYIAGTQEAFVNMMNQQAKVLGMKNTHFSDVMGLPAPNHYSSAYDLALLARAIINQFPEYYSWYEQKFFTFNGIKQPNYNKLLFIYPYADGLKTGSTGTAGYSLVSSAEQPNNPTRLISVVMSAGSPMASAISAKALFSYGFRFFNTKAIYLAGQPLQQANVSMGKAKKVPVGITKTLFVTYPIVQKSKLSAHLAINDHIEAPVTKGQVLGQVTVMLGDKTLAKVDAVALKNNPKGSWWQRLAQKVTSLV